MNRAPAIEAGANPFSRKSVLALVLLGSLIFVALLWSIGAGMMSGPLNDGGGHAGGKGLNGFAGYAELIGKSGRDVRLTRTKPSLERPGLMILTPPHGAKGEELSDVIARHRGSGPTILILPKWSAATIPPGASPDAKRGWVMLGNAHSPRWDDELPFVGNLDLKVEKLSASEARWEGLGVTGSLPDDHSVQSLSSGRILPLVRDGRGQTLAGIVDDGGHPIVVVAEPDLLDNYGFARKENALLAVALTREAMGGEDLPVHFDVTLNGHGRSTNLLTLAFTPPFLAATLCLLMAAFAVAWRALLRFGSPKKRERAIAFGKAALVSNAGGLIRRTRRLHLISGPYVRRVRDRIAKALALHGDGHGRSVEAAIDRAVDSRMPGSPAFSQIAERMRSARNPHDLLQAAQQLSALERTLMK